jgi:hypothetical protein
MEDIINQIDGQVQIIFERGSGYQKYCDAIWMSQEEYDATPSETIESLKQQRYDNWIAVINALPTVEPISLEDTTIVDTVMLENSVSSDSGTTAPTQPV